VLESCPKTIFCQQFDTQSIGTVDADGGVDNVNADTVNVLQDVDGADDQVIVFLCLDGLCEHSSSYHTRNP